MSGEPQAAPPGGLTARLVPGSAPLWTSGFRPFFLLGPAYGVLVMALTVAASLGHWSPPWPYPLWVWHGHEMMFGFASAIVSGFVLTALPSWAGTPEVRPGPLAVLAAAWIAGRVAFWASPGLDSPWLAIDAGYYLLYTVLLAPGLLACRYRSALALLAILLGFLVANVVFYLRLQVAADALVHWSLRLAVDSLVVLFTVVAGFLAPEFTRNVLRDRGDPRTITFRPAIETAAIGGVVLFVALDLAPVDRAWSGAAALFACGANAVRIARWRSAAILDTPLLWVMHLGYAWLVIALGLWAVEGLTGQAVDSPALHAFTVGAYGLVKMGVMSRVALKHTGRELEPGRVAVAAYLLMLVAAATRVPAPWLPATASWLVLSGVLWAVCMAIYLARFGSYLARPSLPRRDAGRL